jgi:hypothetical protein
VAATVLPLALVVALVGAFTIEATADNNDIAVNVFSGLLSPREGFRRAISRGVFREVPDGAVVRSLESVAWVNGPYVQWHGGPRIDLPIEPLAVTPCATSPSGVCPTSAPQFAVTQGGYSTGVVTVVAPYLASRIYPANTADAFASQAWLYLERPDIRPATAGSILETVPAAPAPAMATTPRNVEPGEVRVVQAGRGWAVLELRLKSGVLSLQALKEGLLGPRPEGG